MTINHILSIVIPIIVLPILLWAVGTLIRSEAVYNYRSALLDRVTIAAREDIIRGDFGWHVRYETMRAVTYERMVLQFWRPLRSFYTEGQMRIMLGPGLGGQGRADNGEDTTAQPRLH